MNEENPPILEKKNNSVAKEIIIFIVIFFGIVLPFRMYVVEPYLVDGRSMDPTFATGDYLMVNKISYRTQTPKRNSVVVFNATDAKNPNTNFIKRIIGLPGDTVIMKDNVVTIINSENPDGFVLDQSYVKKPCVVEETGCIKSFKTTLGKDEYYVMGDNRAESYDSRYWGPLEKKYILGKPFVRLFGIKKVWILPIPILSKFSILPGNDTK